MNEIPVTDTERGKADSQFGEIRSNPPTAFDPLLTNIRKKGDTDVQEWVDKIKSVLASAQSAVFEIGSLLIAAKRELKAKEYVDVVIKAGLNCTSNADNYIRVAKAPHLLKHQGDLPVGVGALIDLVPWSETEIKKSIEDRVLHPHATRKDLKTWVDKVRAEATGEDPEPEPEPEPKAQLLLQVYVDLGFDWPDSDTDKLEEYLAKFGAPIHWRRVTSPQERYLKAMGVWHEKVMTHIRKVVRMKVSALKKQYKKQKRVWGFLKDDLDIPGDANDERIKNVLEEIGQGGSYERLWDDAVAAVKQPEPPPDRPPAPDPEPKPTEAEIAADVAEAAAIEEFKALAEAGKKALTTPPATK
jgi:hypothetical protein